MSTMKGIRDIKVKCFNNRTMTDTENSMNTWLTTKDIDVIEIKFSTAIDGSGYRYYSILVIYREN